ncbi:acyl-CoA carboxylase subunit epsilon [Embleya sp. NPDC055664]|uniref:Acetyl-CoA carboxylase biotin carboxyl carrier protein subunit n=1 Tax=Embleya scabrispora TaxID=159449 RepID=A0A1T3NX69_9ACTN|nr:acyl-CoA carboxylase subunit epsilon [Embleya scabrispora]OPC81282.1 acetyl-CoA carboxylase biotin carboxyl carrier protein subunit [Embleya scabrispora]
MIKVVRGEPTPEELAVIVTVVAAKASGGGAPAPAPAAPSQWNDPARLVRRPLRPGPGAWQASAWPS